jgi:ADP-dependent NAD(P)H-hydrate dehydratase
MSEPARLDADLLQSFPLPRLSEDGDKEDRGRVLIIGGSREVPGAAILAGMAGMRAGAGKLQVATEDMVAVPVAIALPEARVTAGSPIDAVREADAVVLGCGMTPGAALDRLLAALLGCGAETPLVLDATVLGCLPDMAEAVRGWRGGVTLLPHAREMARLLECDPEEVERDPANAVTASSLRRTAACFASGAAASVLPRRGRGTSSRALPAALPRAGPTC